MTGHDRIAVDGYPARPSVRAGNVIRLHIATSADLFRVDFYRYGATTQLVGSVTWAGQSAPSGRFDEDWQWPAYDFPVPRDWESGVYIVVLGGTLPSAPPVLDARQGRLLFVVTPRVPSGRSILYKVPVLTYHAYNSAGGGNLYSAPQVSLLRPGGGVGGPVKGLPDAYDPTSPRQTFAHWDAPFIAWMEANGYESDFCTDLDIARGQHLSHGYRLLLSAGHDEYWSSDSRRHITAFRYGGGNIANFGANTCWWHVHLTNDATQAECSKFPPHAPAGTDPDSSSGCPDHWWESEPENTLLGVSYRNGGGHWDGSRTPLGYTVTDADHWTFAGTGLRTGETFGQDQALIGYECDGAAYAIDRYGRPRPTGEDGTPRNFEILGIAPLPSDWNVAAREQGISSPRAATLGLYESTGTVFTAATTDWARLLASDPHVATITRNVVSRLSQPS
jgi:hypothetical protein